MTAFLAPFAPLLLPSWAATSIVVLCGAARRWARSRTLARRL